MKPPLFVRPLVEKEREQLRIGLRATDAFTLRRSQILLASADGQRPARIAATFGCSTQTVRDAIRAFSAEGTACLRAKAKRPKTIHAVWQRDRDGELRALLHQTPRNFGKPRSTWTLELLAEVCHERGLTARRLTGEAIRCILERLEINWKRAKLWMTSPDPNYVAKKARRDRLIRLAARQPDWVLGFEDEVWWSRLARPLLNTWTDGDPMKIQILATDENDPDPDAIACYGFLRLDTRRVRLRFVEDRPLGDVTI